MIESGVRERLEQVWQGARAWLVSDYLLMPDHLHCFCFPGSPTIEMEAWLAYWKSMFWRTHENATWQFQSLGWHHRLRNDESYSEKWDYVQMNPVRKGLVARAEDWKFKGRVHDVMFRG